ncbi:MAG: UbiX family flavin prenyltransferase [Methanothrix sp.]|nr:UbiX family flavin prenyltransferase [Methanothrix sp.]MDD4448113.1 UbiX family flavin prenyltransferase [Methanothrix sp.]
MEIVVGISGASGAAYAVRLLQVLRERGIIIHLIITDSATRIIEIETDYQPKYIQDLADYVYSPRDFTAPFASGSHLYDGMVVIPCSMGTLSAIACGSSDTLITRAADVCLKEKRRLIIVPRETPLGLVQLRNMVAAAEAGAVVLPACPAFYSRPSSLDDLVDVLVGRVLDLLGVKNDLYRRWQGTLERKCL